jgi:hypothetical protein
MAESHELLLFVYSILSLQYYVNTNFLRNSIARHLKNLPLRKNNNTEFSAKKNLLGLIILVRVIKIKIIFLSSVLE